MINAIGVGMDYFQVVSEYLQLPVLGQLILASLFGGAIGWEREYSGKEAGLRTNLLICIGATLLTILSLRIGDFIVADGSIMADPSRLMAAVISGIGFLGAGTIIQARGEVTGLTTAATLWVVAAIGIAIGARAFIVATGSTIFVLVALFPLGMIERKILEPPIHWIKVSINSDLSAVNALIESLEHKGLEVRCTEIDTIENDKYELFFEVKGDEDVFKNLPLFVDEHEDIYEIQINPEL